MISAWFRISHVCVLFLSNPHGKWNFPGRRWRWRRSRRSGDNAALLMNKQHANKSPKPLSPVSQKKWKKIKKKVGKKTTILPPIENPMRAAFSTGVGTWALTLLFLPLLFLFYMHMPRPVFPLTTSLFWQDRKMRKVGKNYDAYACFSFSALILISKFLF